MSDTSEKTRISSPVTRIGKYDVIDVLGHGGMGVVYRGIDRRIGREVAIKTLTQGFAGDPDMLARFYDEAQRTGRLKHANIVTVYDMGDENGVPYIVMECIDGDPLDKLIKANAPLSMATRLRIIEDTCSALGYAHRCHVIHRDVKPANIFVQADGVVKLLDFGIARLEKRNPGDDGRTRTGHIIGTIPYMAPERLRNENIDGRSDIFAAGVVLYQLITGRLPFSGDDVVLMQQILQYPHPPITNFGEFPAVLSMIVDRALAKNPEDRYSAAEEMAGDLSGAITELKQEQIVEMMPEAQRLMEAQEFTRARAVLQQVLKLDGAHPEARQLLLDIQRHFTQRQREERIQQIRQLAEDAIEEKRFDQSLSMLEEALKLDASNPELQRLQKKAQREKEKQERIEEYLTQAELARRRGDYESAIAAAQKALKVDKSNSRVVAMCNLLSREAEQAGKQVQARRLLDAARAEISARRYNEAIELLRQVEQFDPTNAELSLLLGDANAGLNQIRRRETVAAIESEVTRATTLEELQHAAQSIHAAMAAMPSESALFRLKTQVDRQLRDHENRRLVDETVQKCRDLRPREALELVREALQRVPGDERLMSLDALLTERFRQQTVEERRSEYVQRAREALGKSQFTDAVRILELCQNEGIATNEILSLLDFARTEELEHQRQETLRNNLAKAQVLMRDESFDECIGFLEEAIRRKEDTALRMLLDQAETGRAALRKQVEGALASAAKLAQAGRIADSLHLLESQSSGVQRSEKIQMALRALREESNQALYRMIGRAYAVLESDLPTGEKVIRRVAAATDPASTTRTITKSFRARGRSTADRVIGTILERSSQLLRDRDRNGAGDLLQRVSGLLDFASLETKTDWHRLESKVSKNTGVTNVRN
ncbi:MAG: protein kinase [Acidobacteriaceae bacterium]